MSAEHGEHKEKMGPGKLFAYCAAVGVGFILLSMAAQPIYELARSVAMSFDILTKPILTMVVIGGIAGMVFSGKKGGGGGDHKPSSGEKTH